MELGEAFSFLVSKWVENVIKLKRKNVKNDAYIGYLMLLQNKGEIMKTSEITRILDTT